MSMHKRWATGLAAILLGVSAGAADLQWGFDFTSGEVTNQNGGVVDNDGTGGANLAGQVYPGAQTPVYTDDIPPVEWRRNTAGVGAVNLQSPPDGDVGHLRTVGTTSDLGTAADLRAAGGITVEAWVRHLEPNPGGDDYIVSVGDWYVLCDAGATAPQGGSDSYGSRYKLLMNSSSRPTPGYPISEEAKMAAGWTHVAAVLITGTGDNNTSRLYVDGILRSEKTGLLDSDVDVIDLVAARNICVGGHHTFPAVANRFQGLVYEPRITLGVLTPEQFTVNTDDTDGDDLMDLWEYKTFTNLTFATGGGDADHDGASNAQEMVLGTDPLDPDSDDDGLTDGVETATGYFVSVTDTGTHPQVADADNDGVVDGAEVLVYGSDPFMDDVDNDFSPDIIEVTLGTDPADDYSDPYLEYNLLLADVAVGDDWTIGAYFSFGSADADDLWVIAGAPDLYGQLIRNPEGPGTTFPGPALILSGPGATFRMKQDDGEAVVVDNLQLRGGTVDNGNTGMTLILDGAVTVSPNAVSNRAEVVTTPTSTNVTWSTETDSVFELIEGNRGIIVDASIAGTGGLIVRQSYVLDTPATLSIRSINNPFTGGWRVENIATLKAAGLNSLGSGDITLAGGTLDVDYNLALLDATLTVADAGSALVVDREHYVGALVVGGQAVAAGTYTAADLAALVDPAYANAFVDGGGTVTVTGIGNGDADGNGIPDAWEIANFGSIGQDPNSDVDDGDGLTIAMEFAAGTNPRNSDTDGDTLGDSAEIFTYGTDPTAQDTDGDTLRDDAELAGAGARPPTDPRVADTDGDTLDDGVESNTGVFVDASDTGTNPTLPDTDGDRFEDGEELAEGSDPTDPGSVPTGFADDFQAYPVSNPSDFSATGNWTWNGVGTTGNDNRIFDTINYGGTRLWIAAPGANGSGITSAGIALDPDTDYAFLGNLVAETWDGARDCEFAVDLLIGAEVGSAVSVVGGPVTVFGRGDGDGTVPPGSIDDSYEDQLTTIPFNSGALAPTDRLFIQIVYVGPGTNASPPFAGVDNIRIVKAIDEDADDDGLLDEWEITHFGAIDLYDDLGDPDDDRLNNAGEQEWTTDPMDKDTDGDGCGDGDEVLTAGTDPLDSGSVLKVVDAADVPGGFVEWASVPGKTYRVQHRAGLSAGEWTDLADVSASGAATTSYTDPAAAGTEGYYRVLVLGSP